jgi:bacillolysin
MSLVGLFVSLHIFAAAPRFDDVHTKKLPKKHSAVRRATGSPVTVESLAPRLREHLARVAPAGIAATKKNKPITPATGARSMSALPYRANGTPRQIQRANTTRAAAVSASAIDTAREFLREHRALLRIDDPDLELAVTSRTVDDLGRTHVRFEQQHEGIPVWPAELIVHLDAAGPVDFVASGHAPTPRRVATKPAIGAEGAITRARSACGGESTSIPELIVYTREGYRPRLGWKLTVHESLIERWVVVIDAMNGAVLERFNSVPTGNVSGTGRDLRGNTRTLNVWQEGSSFYLLDSSKAMFDPTSQAPSPQRTRGGIFIFDAQNQPATSDPDRLPGNLTVVSSSNPNSWPVADTVSAAFWLSQTYDYFVERHGRTSIDGNKGSLNAIVRLGQGFANAFWDGEQDLMVFGDNDTYADSLDVIAHEMAHGVTDHSARLVYKDQSGAINEAMSDVFGEMAEARTYGSNDWILGTHMNRAVRSMSNPRQFDDPSKMSEFLVTSSDNGGVHSNSGIVNRAYYLLAQSIGLRDSERIFYRALTQHLTRDSQFIDLRLAAIASAQELFGAGSAQATKTAEAFDAVEIFASAPIPEEPPIPVVSGPDASLFVYRDDPNGSWFLGRKEGNDPAIGVKLSRGAMFSARPSVSGDGTLAVFVDADRDVCLIATNGSTEEICLDLPSEGIRVASVGMSPDASLFGFVLFGVDGDPENEIVVVDLATEQETHYTVDTPTYDGTSFSTVDYADQMVFTADGSFLVYDALNEIFANGEAWQAWSIYAVDLATGDVYSVIPPIDGLDIGFPALGHTSDGLVTFEAYESATGDTGIFTSNLDSGDSVLVGVTRGTLAAPSYTGDDRAVIYAVGASNAAGASLVRQALGSDSLTPVGTPTPWITGATFGVAYRRGTYAGPTTQPGAMAFAAATFNAVEGSVATITVMRSGGNKGAASVNYTTSNGTAQSGTDYQAATGTLTWSDGEDGTKSFQVRVNADSSVESTETINLTLSAAAGASFGTPTTATLQVANSAAPPPVTRRRSVRR